ncbi:sporulation protein [Streptomyces axinellae]|uniref:Sporulation protein n=1 Tax=Streptomyces axinellae TaxID=552788 RepID=A0ABP6C0Q3_9ACTN
MVFKKLMGALGVGGPSVDTVLEEGPVLPGGTLSGQVHLEGGKADAEIERIRLELVAHVEAEHHDGEQEGALAFAHFVLDGGPEGGWHGTPTGGFRLAEGERRSVPFTITLPWETPVTELYGQPLGIALGVRTELEISGAKDKGDLDPVRVAPLPAQEAVLEALGQLGCGFTSADLELGHINGTGQQLPFYQEIELTPPPHLAHSVNEIEVTFLADPGGIEVVLEADKRGGLFSDGHDVLNRFTVSHDEVAHTDWNAEVDRWLRQLTGHHQEAGAHYGGHHHDVGHHHDSHGHAASHSSRSSGPGVGTAVALGAAGLAVGVAGGLVAAEVVDEIGDAFEDEEGEED